MFRSFNFFKSLLIASALLSAICASADIDKKYFNKVAQEVWNSDLPGFDPNANLTDSIFQGQSAAYIARYYGITADYDNSANPLKQRIMGIPNSNLTTVVELKRNMVKIFDQSAAESFTEFSIDSEEKIEQYGITLAKAREVFGARIIKPDGTINEIDVTGEALTRTSGKKGDKDVEYKIAIPGLEAGDILDYFFRAEVSVEEMNLPPFLLNLLTKYPTKLFTIDVRSDSHLNMEYGAYNGAPKVTTFDTAPDGKNLLFLQFSDLQSLDESLPFFKSGRQMPLYEFNVINPNKTVLAKAPDSQRPGGMRLAIPTFVMRDVSCLIADQKPVDKLVGDAHSTVKNWIKEHPDATPEQIADAAWIALNYSLNKQKLDEPVSDRGLVKSFYALMAKLDPQTSVRIGVTTTRNNVSIDEIAHYSEANYIVMFGDRLYFPSNNPTLLPGEMPANLDGEAYILFSAKPDNKFLYQSAQQEKFPASKPVANTRKMVVNASIDPENPDTVIAVSDFTLTGTEKAFFSPMLQTWQIAAAREKFFGKNSGKVISQANQKELEKTREFINKTVELLYGNKDTRIYNYGTTQAGVTPDAPEMKVNIKCGIPDLISQAGNNLMVKLGMLYGKQDEVTGSKRQRDVSIIRSSPSRVDATIYFEIPEGYELVPESLADLTQNVVTSVGAFNTSAEVDGDKVKIRVLERYMHSIYPETSWDDMLKVLDAAAAFNNASIVLRPAK